ncbi:MAG: DUF5104 domain-containing protein [Clostridiales bacterium]|nr:DUF5104 domain-containing protein [Clostridiales bacterium]
MKKRVPKLIIVIIVLILAALTGCSKLLNGKYDPNLSIGEQIKTRHYKGSAEVFGKNQLLDEMLECIKDKDVDRMKKLFSDYALEENKDLTGELEEFYKFFPEIKEVKNKSCASSRSDNIGATEYKYKYQIMADIYDEEGSRYSFICVWIEGCSDKPNMQGLHSLQLVSEDSYWADTFTVHSWDDRPGVYVYN